MEDSDIDVLILRLHNVNAVKFGEYKLKSGSLSPIYIDLNALVSYPVLMNQVSELIYQRAKEENLKKKKMKVQFESLESEGATVELNTGPLVCGVPYTALALATIICSKYELPMVIRRKEAKNYGTKRMVEGSFREDDVCLIIEDTVTSGNSILETAEVLHREGLKVKDAIVLVDREQGGKEMLASKGIRLHSVISIFKLLDVLLAAERIDAQTDQNVRKFILDNNTFSPKKKSSASPSKKPRVEPRREQSYADRATLLNVHPLASKLFKIMEEKQSNLSLSADVTRCEELLQLAECLGPKICALKTHVDILKDYTVDFNQKLKALAEKHNFLIIEDRKFADDGNTVKYQYERGSYQISSWAHIVNAHAISGPGVVDGLGAVGKPLGRGCLLIAHMSSQGSLATGEYTQAVVEMAKQHSDFVIGFICRSKVTDRQEFIHFTPGVKLQAGGDSLGQQYETPEKVIHKGSDIIIVGRGILEASDRLEAAEAYRKAGWDAYVKRVSQ